MKKNVLLLGLALGTLFVTSCKKDYSCDCSYKEAHDDHFDDESKKYPIAGEKKKDAEKKCEDYETLLKADEDHSEVKCDLNKK
jgi:hypothetical protein